HVDLYIQQSATGCVGGLNVKYLNKAFTGDQLRYYLDLLMDYLLVLEELLMLEKGSLGIPEIH
ncbi:unnamed protein product, partial [Didymodactylos carnosus]